MQIDLRRLSPARLIIIGISFAAIVAVMALLFTIFALPAKGDVNHPGRFSSTIKTATAEKSSALEPAKPEIHSLTVSAPQGAAIWEGYTRVDFFTRKGALVRVAWPDRISGGSMVSLTKPDHPSPVWETWLDRYYDQLARKAQEGSHH